MADLITSGPGIIQLASAKLKAQEAEAAKKNAASNLGKQQQALSTLKQNLSNQYDQKKGLESSIEEAKKFSPFSGRKDIAQPQQGFDELQKRLNELAMKSKGASGMLSNQANNLVGAVGGARQIASDAIGQYNEDSAEQERVLGNALAQKQQLILSGQPVPPELEQTIAGAQKALQTGSVSNLVGESRFENALLSGFQGMQGDTEKLTTDSDAAFATAREQLSNLTSSIAGGYDKVTNATAALTKLQSTYKKAQQGASQAWGEVEQKQQDMLVSASDFSNKAQDIEKQIQDIYTQNGGYNQFRFNYTNGLSGGNRYNPQLAKTKQQIDQLESEKLRMERLAESRMKLWDNLR